MASSEVTSGTSCFHLGLTRHGRSSAERCLFLTLDDWGLRDSARKSPSSSLGGSAAQILEMKHKFLLRFF